MGKDSKRPQAIIRAIKAKCLDCSGGEKKEVARCGLQACPLYPYRTGTLLDGCAKSAGGNRAHSV